MVSIANDKIYVLFGALLILSLVGYLIYWFIVKTARSEVVRMYKKIEKTKQKIKPEQTISRPIDMEFKNENSNVLTSGIDDNDSYVDPSPSPILQ